MTIRRRLFFSNVLMIAVPAGIALLIAAGCIAVVWYTVRFGGGLGFHDRETFIRSALVLWNWQNMPFPHPTRRPLCTS